MFPVNEILSSLRFLCTKAAYVLQNSSKWKRSKVMIFWCWTTPWQPWSLQLSIQDHNLWLHVPWYTDVNITYRYDYMWVHCARNRYLLDKRKVILRFKWLPWHKTRVSPIQFLQMRSICFNSVRRQLRAIKLCSHRIVLKKDSMIAWQDSETPYKPRF